MDGLHWLHKMLKIVCEDFLCKCAYAFPYVYRVLHFFRKVCDINGYDIHILKVGNSPELEPIPYVYWLTL